MSTALNAGLAAAVLFLAACTHPPPPPETTTGIFPEKAATVDAPATMPREADTPLPARPISPETADTTGQVSIRTGTHDLTLQWIGWDRPGKAQIEKAGPGRYRIEGAQRKGEDYLKISGILTPSSVTRLLFEGEIIYRVADLNGGQPCDKSGRQEFLSTQGRKYWRLQNMINCEGGLVTDYVDIYF